MTQNGCTMSGMKIITKTILWTVLAVLAVWAAYLTAPEAKASPQSYLSQLEANGFNSDTPGKIVQYGQWVCNGIGLGAQAYPMRDLVASQFNIPKDRAEDFLGITVTELCPQYLPTEPIKKQLT